MRTAPSPLRLPDSWMEGGSKPSVTVRSPSFPAMDAAVFKALPAHRAAVVPQLSQKKEIRTMTKPCRVETICKTAPFDNGAGPTWSRGNSPIVRVGNRVFATNSRVIADRAPLNRTSLELYERFGEGDWRLVFYDEGVYQREPCPILYLGGGCLAVTVNPTVERYAKDQESLYVPCTPMVYLFDTTGGVKRTDAIVLPWGDPSYQFMDHSYRSFAVDSVNGSIFFTNQYLVGEGGEHCYSLLDKDFRPKRCAPLRFPHRSCYHNVAMRDGEAYVFAIQDIEEPNEEWRRYKYEKTGRHWDYDFRKLYLNYSPNLEKEDFGDSILICDRDGTCGWVSNLDCSYDANGDMLLLVSAQNVHEPFMRERFFPNEPLETVLEVYRLSRGRVTERITVDRSAETERATLYGGFFHTASSGEVYLVWSKETDLASNPVQTGTYLSPVSALDQSPVRLMDAAGLLFGSKTRLGARPTDSIDLYWPQGEESILYAGVELESQRAAGSR